jgi:hypothetical protein
MSLQVIVPTCDKYINLMPGFFHQWNKYCGLTGMVVCEQETPELPRGWQFFRAGRDRVGKGWVGNLKLALEQVHEETILLVLDDYWLTKHADVQRIKSVAMSMENRFGTTIDKVDLTNDRIGFPHEDFGNRAVRSLQLAPYLTSTQAAIWRKSFLNRCLINPGWNPWQFEIEGTKQVQQWDHTILGLREPAMHYANIMLKGKRSESEWNKLSPQDMKELESKI